MLMGGSVYKYINFLANIFALHTHMCVRAQAHTQTHMHTHYKKPKQNA